MESVKIIIIFYLITGSLAHSSDYTQLRFLDQLIDIIQKDRPIETILMFWQSEDKTCTLQRWSPSGIPFLRFNELARMRLRGKFNSQALAIVCLREDSESDSELLKLVAEAFDTMRQERIILWMQRKPTKKFLEGLSRQADSFKFTMMMVLEMAHLQDMEIIQFAKRCNASLKVHDGIHEDRFDVKLNPQILTMQKFNNDIEVLTWVWYLLCVYGSFVLVELFILVVTRRITGVPHRLNLWNPLLNLRAFCAILGLSFPELRRASLSLRQLFLAMTVFGFIFSNFFSCKLSALVTKPIEHAQVRNFEELRASGMTTVMDVYLRSYIEREINPEFFNLVVPKVITVEHPELISRGNKIYCDSQDLVITEGLPWVYVTQNNSFYKRPLSDFLMIILETGISKYWMKSIHDNYMKSQNIKPQMDKSNVVPISPDYLCWLWHMLFVGYGIATVAFLFEIALKNRRMRIKRPRTISDTSV
ncbi:uncharacterized protein [Drosophila kikkawai]|uniref:Uncharacterized protein n=1 Tax=Drosophila kikkawai TaxID=30033 RepID=A0ABM3C4L7_DROKI|nr:uncharacterized protein LOC108075385 [Drosophila kikkawai]